MFRHIFIIFLLSATTAFTQALQGTVSEKSENGGTSPLAGASVSWLNAKKGTRTDKNGNFTLARSNSDTLLVVTFIGYRADTINVPAARKEIAIVLSSVTQTEAVEVTADAGTYISRVEATKTEIITSGELEKAACCNLSESFETNASVDVTFSDAVTGAKQIQLLGLNGTYTQIVTENVPSLRGLAAPFGLEYIPGTWMESISISKGASSVTNGYESIAGQINVEYKKPDRSEPLLLNLFADQMGRTEANISTAFHLNERWSTGILAHGNYFRNKTDYNRDGFIDRPLARQANILNRWKYEGDRLKVQLGARALVEDRASGQMSYNHDHEDSTHLHSSYGVGINTDRYELFSKIGLLFPEQESTSLGLILSGSLHNQSAYFGMKDYRGHQNTFIAKLLYETLIGSSDHKITAGASYLFDTYNESLDLSSMHREESVPGLFGEYTYSGLKDLVLVAGLRTDRHNLYGLFITPRMHVKYALSELTALRFSAGRGYRVVNPFADNIAVLTSSRRIVFDEKLQPEDAWNFGASASSAFNLFGNTVTLDLDFYHTRFTNQVILDLDQDVHAVHFYNLRGTSYSNSLQAQLGFVPFTGLDVRAAYRLNDVQMTINGELRDKPLISRDKVLLTVSYNTPEREWQIDATVDINGSGRIPATAQNPAEYRRADRFPAFTRLNGQLSRRFSGFDVYIGGENLTNTVQPNPIIAADAPFSQFFDSSLVWGPLYGRMIYAGLRYSIN